MRSRPLGKSGLFVSEIGFGTWGLGGTHGGSMAYGPTEDADSIAALHRARERGITFYDTADLYGKGHSESLVGSTFKSCRNDVVLATKAGFVSGSGEQNFTLPYLEDALAASLDRLQTTCVDLFQLHNPPLELLQRDAALLEWHRDLKARGKSRTIGISARSPDEALVIVANFEIDAIQVNFNLVDQRALENGLLDRCKDRGVGVIVRTPLCFGFLTGELGNNLSFPGTDHRSRWSDAQKQRWSEANQIFGELLGGRQTPAQLALRFCLSQPGVSTVIPGMLFETHVEENAAASPLGPLSEDEIRRVRNLYQGEKFFVS